MTKKLCTGARILQDHRPIRDLNSAINKCNMVSSCGCIMLYASFPTYAFYQTTGTKYEYAGEVWVMN